jgi:hypothetical protein
VEVAPMGLRADDVGMKPHYFLAAITLAISTFGFGGCADNPSSSSTTSNTNPAQKSYSGNDLQQHTGRQTAGDALQASDPSITTQGR